MRRIALGLLMGAVTVAGVMVTAGSASAAPIQNATCSGAPLKSGTYDRLTVQGVCLVPNGANVTIRNGMTLAPHAVLLAFFTSQNMSIYGGITVGEGAILGLGCTAEFGCKGGDKPPSQDVVRGGIAANNAMSMYLNGDTIYGDVSFMGGGAGRDCVDLNPEDPHSLGHSLAVKDNTFHGTVTLQGWAGCWIGFIRNTVHGVVTIADNYANQDNTAYQEANVPNNFQGFDSTEVATNFIWGALNCSGNTPAAQLGDSGGSLNVVHGSVTGECLAVV